MPSCFDFQSLQLSPVIPLVLRIRSLTFYLYLLNYNIQFLWISSHTGIHGNEIADKLAKSTSNLICSSFTQLSQFDFTPLIQQFISNLWSSCWNNLLAGFALKYRNITSNIIKKRGLITYVYIYIDHTI